MSTELSPKDCNILKCKMLYNFLAILVTNSYIIYGYVLSSDNLQNITIVVIYFGTSTTINIVRLGLQQNLLIFSPRFYMKNFNQVSCGLIYDTCFSCVFSKLLEKPRTNTSNHLYFCDDEPLLCIICMNYWHPKESFKITEFGK